MLRGSSPSPYRWFFPLAAICGLVGVGWWVVFPTVLSTYPGALHADLMIGGFFLAAAVGFLLTAVPRLTTTSYATHREIAALFVAQSLVFICGVLQQSRGMHLAIVAVFLLLLRFATRRIRHTTQPLPPALRMGGAGLLSGLIGSVLITIGDYFSLPPELLHAARTAFVLGLPMGLMLGIGTRLIPTLLGLSNTPILPTPTPATAAAVAPPKYRRGEGYALLWIVSFGFDTWTTAPLPWGFLLRALLVSEILLRHWRIWRLPVQRGVLAWCLYASTWAMFIGSWAPALSPRYSIHLEHLVFIGGISLMIFAISTRVTIAHGGHSFAPEKNSWRLRLMAACLALALLARLSAPFVTNYFPHLAYAALTWILAAFCWLALIVPRLWPQRAANL